MKAENISRNENSKKGKLEEAIPLDTPYSIHIDPCNVCNLKCKFCFQAGDYKHKKQFMSWQTFKLFILDIHEFSKRIKKVKIGLHGEPTLHPKLPAMISKFSLESVVNVVELFTNGVRLESNLNQKLIDAGLDQINVSIEGLSSKKYREITGVKVNFKKLVAGIRDFYNRSRGKCRVYIKMVNANLTPKDVSNFYTTFENICDEIFIENIVPQWAETGMENLPDVGMYGQKIDKDKKVCPFPFMYLHINSDGSVSPCTLDWNRKVILGNIHKESLLSIWEGDKLKSLQKEMLKSKRCDINFCNNCLAPVYCCNENLDKYAQEIWGG